MSNVQNLISESAFPSADRLTYRDGDTNVAVLTEQDGTFQTPPGGWNVPRRIYTAKSSQSGNQSKCEFKCPT